jgi:hypothetical protein
MKTLTRVLAFTLIAFSTCPAHAFKASPAAGILQVTVVDEDGHYVSDAPVYVYKKDKEHITAAKEASGVATFQLQPGIYKLYAAKARPVADGVARYTSHEARVRVSFEENASVILKLQPQTDDTPFAVPDSVRRKIGLDPQLAKYLD